MPYPIQNHFVIGISSSALFDAQEEDRIFRTEREQAFIRYQIQNEKVPFAKGTGFALVESLLRLNTLSKRRLVEVIILSHNHPAAALRIMNSLGHYNLDITRAAFVRDTAITCYLKPFNVALFLSKKSEDVKDAIRQGVAAAILFNPPEMLHVSQTQLRIAFDGDAVLFSGESEQIWKTQGADAFFKHEIENAENPLPAGPFAPFLRWLAKIQNDTSIRNEDGSVPIRTALVTARNRPAIDRVILTLRAWGVSIDEAFFLGGIEKTDILKAFSPHIFIDDQIANLKNAAHDLPVGQCPVDEPEARPPIPAQMEELETQPEPEPELTISERDFRTRCNSIFRSYTPLSGTKGRIDPQYMEFVNANASRKSLERARIIEALDKYDLSDLKDYEPMMNRERGEKVQGKLQNVVDRALGEQQRELGL
jgi:5'-nucleotidase